MARLTQFSPKCSRKSDNVIKLHVFFNENNIIRVYGDVKHSVADENIINSASFDKEHGMENLRQKCMRKKAEHKSKISSMSADINFD